MLDERISAWGMLRIFVLLVPVGLALVALVAGVLWVLLRLGAAVR